MRKYTVVSLSLIASLMLVLVFSAIGAEKKISKKELPAAVLTEFEQTYPKAVIKGLSKEVEHGKTFFEIESVDGTTRRDLLYLADGKVAEIEEAVAMNELPDAVKVTVTKGYPKGKIAKMEKTTRGDVVTYEIHFVNGKAKSALVVDPSGRVLKNKKANDKKETEEKEEDEKSEGKK